MSVSSPTFHLINHTGSALRIPEPSFQSAIVSSQSLLLQLSLVPLLPTTSVTPALLRDPLLVHRVLPAGILLGSGFISSSGQGLSLSHCAGVGQ